MTEPDVTRIARLEERLRAHDQLHGVLQSRLDRLEQRHTLTLGIAILTTALIAAATAGVAATLTTIAERVAR